ncbi:unnamed protein product [Musa hybrid cultivar]
MEAKRAKVFAASAVVSLLVLLVVLWICLGPSTASYIVSGLIFAAILAILAWVLTLYTALDRMQMSAARWSALEREELRVEYSFLRKVAGLPIKFRLDDLVVATDNFQGLVGRGSSASVFRGILDDGTPVAVKRIEAAERGDREFRSEVSAIASIQHVNLVRLLGYCIDHDGRRRCLPWAMRYRAAVDVAKALSYLHHDCRARVLHLDVKPENILLDEGFRAVVADFGLSKLMGKDESRVVTTIRGTRGYLAPEWIIGSGVSDKSDIYSYGMVLLEMKVRQGRMMEVVDERLKSVEGPPDEKEVRTLVHVALWCIQEKAETRPSMARVVDMLEGRIAVDDDPPKPDMIISSLLSPEPDVFDEAGAKDTHAAAAGMLELDTQSATTYSLDVSSILRPVEFGRSYVVRPKGRHQATIVWLHGLGDNGASCSHLVETLPLPNIKWICPTAPTRPVAMFGGFACTAWFDIGEISEDGADDVDGMDASAAHIANLLSSEPPDVKLGIGGFSMGAAAALYSATCFTHGKYGNGSVYPINLSAVVGLSGWLPCSRSLKTKVDSSQDAARRAASLPLLLCHGRGDGVVPYAHGERSAEVLRMSGFRNLTFKTFNGLEHYTTPEEMDAVCKWLTARLRLDGSRS